MHCNQYQGEKSYPLHEWLMCVAKVGRQFRSVQKIAEKFQRLCSSLC